MLFRGGSVVNSTKNSNELQISIIFIR